MIEAVSSGNESPTNFERSHPTNAPTGASNVENERSTIEPHPNRAPPQDPPQKTFFERVVDFFSAIAKWFLSLFKHACKDRRCPRNTGATVPPPAIGECKTKAPKKKPSSKKQS